MISARLGDLGITSLSQAELIQSIKKNFVRNRQTNTYFRNYENTEDMNSIPRQLKFVIIILQITDYTLQITSFFEY